ncbi:MAG: hypothetical protein CSB48_08650 [Proteobacteria bacterium]|nr:MAG: hypothetical protein CSB48_08650 [Pseudomonadota bacterium]
MSSKKLVVRINNIEALDAPASPREPDEIVVYHWHRIVGVAAGFALLIGLAVYLVVSFAFNAPRPASQVAGVDTEKSGAAQESVSPEKSQDTPSAMVTSVAAEVASTPQPAQPDVAENTQVTQVPESPEIAEPDGAEQIASIADLPATSAARFPEIQVFTPGFSRVQLTSSLKDKLPVDELTAVVRMNEEGLLRVYLFTEMTGLKGKSFYHNWYLDEKRMARVKVPAYSKLTRASSSKFIDRYMMGNWRVEIVDGAGDIQATAEFSVQ